MSFFKNFPIVSYKFGDETSSSLFQNLSVYVDLVEKVSDNASFYEYYTILDGERPDTLSYKLYNTVDYYWMFALLNPKLFYQGWPLTSNQLYDYAAQLYPYQTITVNTPDTSTLESFLRFYNKGDVIYQGSVISPSAKAVIVEKITDLGQLIVKPIKEVRSVIITDPGAGYNYPPIITINGGEGEGATASASLVGNQIGSIAIVTGGDNYTSAPTVTIDPPDLVDYLAVADTIEQVAAGTLTSGDYYTLLTKVVRGYKIGDINNSGSITILDKTTLINYNTNPGLVNSTIRNWIRSVLRPEILSQPELYPAWLGGGLTDVQATAIAVLSSNLFANNQTINVVGESITTPVTQRGVVNQYDGIHHFENTTGDWSDIDLRAYTGSTSVLTPVTVFNRLDEINTELRRIKVFKPDVANQINIEYQKLLKANQ